MEKAGLEAARQASIQRAALELTIAELRFKAIDASIKSQEFRAVAGRGNFFAEHAAEDVKAMADRMDAEVELLSASIKNARLVNASIERPDAARASRDGLAEVRLVGTCM
jgi:hypothetical protein